MERNRARVRRGGLLLAALALSGAVAAGCSPGVDVAVTVYIAPTPALDAFAAADKIRIEAIGIDEASGLPEILKSREYSARSGRATLGLIKFSEGMVIKVEVLDVEGNVVAYGGSLAHDILRDTPEEDIPAEIFVFVTPVRRTVHAVSNDGIAPSILTAGRIGHTVTALHDGRVLVTGGGLAADTLGNLDPMTISRTADIYDVESGKFVTVTDGLGMPNPLTVPRAFHAAVLLPAGGVLLTGGLTVQAGALSTVATGETFAYPGCLLPRPTDIVQRATCGVIAVPNVMSDGRGRHTATLRPDGSVLLTGGTFEIDTDPVVYLNTTELWTESGGFATTGAAPMNEARAYHTATGLPDGQVLVTGGLGGGGAMPDVLSSVEIYTGTGWMSLGAMSTARAAHTANLGTVEGGAPWVLIVGGFTEIVANVLQSPTSLVESFEPGVGFNNMLARIIEGMPNGLAHHTATTIPDGRIVVMGGKTGGNLSSIFVSVIDPSTTGPTFLSDPLGFLETPRALHGAAVLPSGQVIAIAGFYAAGMNPTTRADADVFTPPVPR